MPLGVWDGNVPQAMVDGYDGLRCVAWGADRSGFDAAVGIVGNLVVTIRRSSRLFVLAFALKSCSLIVPLVLLLTVAGCSPHPDDQIHFLEQVSTQVTPVNDFADLRFTDENDQLVSITELMDHDYLVLVITRGFDNAICLYCSSQTSKWARRSGELDGYGAQLAVVFPTLSKSDENHLGDLKQKIQEGPIPNDSIPYPILVDFDLTSVDRLGLRAELAKPATYIIDRSGRVRFAYVGQSIADRPSVDAILEQLERLGRLAS